MTPFLVLAMHPIGAAGIDRMPGAVASLAVWAPLSGLVFFCRSAGMAYNEVVRGIEVQSLGMVVLADEAANVSG